MAHPSLAMSERAVSATPSERADLDAALAVLADHATELARLSPQEKASLLRECIAKTADCAHAWATEGAAAMRLPASAAGEVWLSGPLPTVRMARLLAQSLDAIAAGGRPPLGRKSHTRADGRLEVDVFPASAHDRVLFAGFSAKVLFQEGITKSEAIRRQAAFYHQRNPEGGVSLVLGAGNVSSIPPMDVFTKMFADGNVCLLKMNPVNEWAGPYLERALSPLIARGFLRVVYGGADVGSYLVYHPTVADVHITGSDRTHDLIVWGPEGAERDRRLADNEPLLEKPITSELGNVSPVAIVPYTYGDDELAFQARNLATMVINNASFNCNAAKMIITARGWSQREQFLDLVAAQLAKAPPRCAYYPGAFDRYQQLTGQRDGVERFGEPGQGELAWALIRGVDSDRKDEPLFRTEPFCGIVSETAVGSADPIEFLATATPFMNDRLWGTLNAALIVHPALESDPATGKAIDDAVVALRYGTVGINHWPAVSYGIATAPWGGHDSVNLKDIQSGLGFVHNTFLLDGIDKSILRGPLKAWPAPVWFWDNAKAAKLGPRLVDFEAAPSWLKVPGIALRAL
ncbi:MAG TPA: aldehyde dehydrogenase family protein [Kofleriaceae bacterium]|nr:aldehyde dehydrogenase family protein [Kofleriaceae bacterium]